jgi:hypothetical protein
LKQNDGSTAEPTQACIYTLAADYKKPKMGRISGSSEVCKL